MNLVWPNTSLLPDRAYYREMGRPWKIFSLACGMSWLFYGALTYHIGDWDVGLSLVMGLLTYLLAPWACFLIVSALTYRKRYWGLHILAGVALGIFVADTSYMTYHRMAGNITYREANFPASMALFYLCGMIWLPRCSLKEALHAR